jgi:phage-related protein
MTGKPRKVRPAVFFATAAGREPVREWLRGLPDEDRKTIGGDIQALEFGEPMGLPLVGGFGDGLWEVRVRLSSRRIARVFFMLDGPEMVLLHGFMKKSQKTPEKDVRLARQRKRDWESGSD